MPTDTEFAHAPRRTLSGPDNLERILLGACAIIWLGALAAAVAATVTLVDLAGGRGTVRAELSEASGSDSPWVLYTVIGVSAVVIAVAIPLLVRARQQSTHRPVRDQTPSGASVGQHLALPTPAASRRDTEVALETGTRSAALPAVVDQVYVRCALSIGCAVGAGTLAVGVATDLTVAGSASAAVAFYIIAGIITVAMPVLPWFYLRELRGALGLDAPTAS
ncbi:MAG: DUF2561 family protein [Mycobacterium sp.]|jgi:hypothetical protein